MLFVTYFVKLSYSSKVIQQSVFRLMTALPVDKFSLHPTSATRLLDGYWWRLSIKRCPLLDRRNLSLCLTSMGVRGLLGGTAMCLECKGAESGGRSLCNPV